MSMYQDQRACKVPNNTEQTIWRYIDLMQLISLLENQSLHFTRVDQLNDPFEGEVPKMNFEDREMVIEELGLVAEEAEAYKDMPLIGFDFFKKNVFLNCWHMNSNESIAMWKLYLESDNGIAIKSNFQDLREAVDTDEEYKTFISEVDYIDYDIDIMPEYNALLPFVYKRKEFEHEKELRVIIYSPPPSEPDGFDEEKGLPQLKTKWKEQPIGVDLEIDLECLIDGIHVAPEAPN